MQSTCYSSGVAASPGLVLSGRLRLVHDDSHHQSVGGGGEDLQGRAASAPQDLKQDVRGRVPAVMPRHSGRHLPG